MRVGIIGLLHESNTFVPQPTTLDSFRSAVLLTGNSIRPAFADAHHEIGGFLAGLDAAGETVEAVPIFAARALPSGTITAATFTRLVNQLLTELAAAGDLDGLLVAPHGATVSEDYPDADGQWLHRVRQALPMHVPIVGTIDPHANLSPLMVESTSALIAYRRDPHLDQRARGIEAAELLLRTLRNDVRPTMAAVFPPLAISIQRQATSEPHLKPHYDAADNMLTEPGLLSNSIVLGFPYADVAELGTATIVITDHHPEQALERAEVLANRLWQSRADLQGHLLGVAEAIDRAESLPKPVCLLDMGDNVGGGSAADGTFILQELLSRQRGKSFVCLFDPHAVQLAIEAGAGATLTLEMGGHVDTQHGRPCACTVTVRSLHEGKFREEKPRHGGMTEFDQGPTAVVETDSGISIMLTTRRMVPFSLEQLRSCDLQPEEFDFLVAKGVNAPLAAYDEVCPSFLRVNTPGSTCADMTQLNFRHRRRPLYPFEQAPFESEPREAHARFAHAFGSGVSLRGCE